MKMVINRNESKLITKQFRQSNKIIENPKEIDNFKMFFISMEPAPVSEISNSYTNPNDYNEISTLGSFFFQATCEQENKNTSSK